MQLLLATRNEHKTSEIRALCGMSYKISNANEYPDFPKIEETGQTFLENASLKALGISQHTHALVLADDSGLEVDALDGAPGVWSSSYGGEEGNHEKNNSALIQALKGVPKTKRSARFRCVMVLAHKGELLAHFEGTVEGQLTSELSGKEGFGYDPLFIPEGYFKTFAELGVDTKNLLSHRSRALEQVQAWLESHAKNLEPPQP